MTSAASRSHLLERVMRLKASAVCEDYVISVQPEYIVIGNFAHRYDGLTILGKNLPSGLSDETFKFSVEASSRTRNLHITEDFGDTIVIVGDKSDLAALRADLGTRFSYAHIDAESLEGLVRAEADYRANGYAIPGSQPIRPQPRAIH